MMKLLAPLGLLGLLGVVALIIIYIIKPNYQQKFVSSTFVWKLSLKYRKRKIPINKLRNLLIIICQILILTLSAFILARPNEVFENDVTKNEYVLVIDSSASMRTEYDDVSRFDRAIDKVITEANRIFGEEEGTISVIIADENPRFLTTNPEVYDDGTTDDIETFRQVNASKAFMLQTELEILKEEDACSYGQSDVNRAMELAQEIIDENPTAKVYFYTDTTYNDANMVNVISVNEETEWNAGVLSAEAVPVEYYYEFHVEIGYYAHPENAAGIGRIINVSLMVNNTNAIDRENVGVDMGPVSTNINCKSGEPKTLIFKNAPSEEEVSEAPENIIYVDLEDFFGTGYRVNSFSNFEITINDGVTDSNVLDDRYIVYGNQKNIIKIQYVSSLPNNFAPAALTALKDQYADRWDIQITEVQEGKDYELEGFDLYIFEHVTPDSLPMDGAVMFFNPEETVPGSDFTVTGERDYEGARQYLQIEENISDTAAQVLKGGDWNNIFLTKGLSISESGYDVLVSCNGSPALMVKNVRGTKIAVTSFSPHFSNFSIRKEYFIWFNNVFNYFFPTIIAPSDHAIGDSIGVNVMSSSATVVYEVGNLVYHDYDLSWYYEETPMLGQNFSFVFDVTMPGVYKVMQTSYFGKNYIEEFFVAMPSYESNIWQVDTMDAPIAPEYQKEFYKDLLLYIAAALVFFLFAEWLLHVSENS